MEIYPTLWMWWRMRRTYATTTTQMMMKVTTTRWMMTTRSCKTKRIPILPTFQALFECWCECVTEFESLQAHTQLRRM